MRGSSRAYEVMDDVADAAKHGALRNPQRNSTLQLSALCEFNQQHKFRFIRNVLYINHSTHGEVDFIQTARDAITYCNARLAIGIQWGSTLKKAPQELQDKVRLRFDPRLGVGMDNFGPRFVFGRTGKWPFEFPIRVADDRRRRRPPAG
jgi:hypothetical protein